MTKKDYELIAQAIKRVGGDTEYCRRDAVVLTRAHVWNDVDVYAEDLIRELAKVFESDNPRFDKAEFFAACGLEV